MQFFLQNWTAGFLYHVEISKSSLVHHNFCFLWIFDLIQSLIHCWILSFSTLEFFLIETQCTIWISKTEPTLSSVSNVLNLFTYICHLWTGSFTRLTTFWPKFYLQLVHKPYFGTWILLFFNFLRAKKLVF